jgi:hypothetical protein
VNIDESVSASPTDNDFLREIGIVPTAIPPTAWQARMHEYHPHCERFPSRGVILGVLCGAALWGILYLVRVLWCAAGRQI